MQPVLPQIPSRYCSGKQHLGVRGVGIHALRLSGFRLRMLVPTPSDHAQSSWMGHTSDSALLRDAACVPTGRRAGLLIDP